VLRITNLTLARGTKRLLEGAQLTVHPGHKIGLVGANGSGKSSLFALLLGELHAETGDCETVPVIVREMGQPTGPTGPGHGPVEDSRPRPRRPAYASVPSMILQCPRRSR